MLLFYRHRAEPRVAPRTGRRSRGQAVVEFALVVPVLVLLLLITIDFGRAFFTYVQVNNAAREGAAYGAAQPTDTSGITTRAQQEINAQAQKGENPLSVGSPTCALPSGTTIDCAIAPGGGGTGNTITVAVSENFSFLTPLINGIFNNNFNVGASSTAVVLNLVASGGIGAGTCTTQPNASFVFSVSGNTVSLNASASTPNSGLCQISGYNWDMGDNADPDPPITGVTIGTYNHDAIPVPGYTYAAAGSYVVTLEVTNQAGNSTTTQTVVIGSIPTPTPSPTPTPTPTPTPSPSPLPTCSVQPGIAHQTNGAKPDPTVTFQGSYTGIPAPATWSWDFRDGNTGTGQNPSHTYTGSALPTNGKVTVALTITTAACQATVSDTFKP